MFLNFLLWVWFYIKDQRQLMFTCSFSFNLFILTKVIMEIVNSELTDEKKRVK